MKMKIFTALLMILFSAASAETLFQVKDNTGKVVLDVSTDGLRILNGSDTLMVISSSEIKAYIQEDGNKALSRSFSVTSASSGKGVNKVFEIATDEGATFYNPDDNSDEIFSIKKGSITANVNPDLSRSFEINDQVTQKGSGNLMKISNEALFEAVNDSCMLWYKDKNAFRVGYVLINNDSEVGRGSFASGYQSKASGNFSSAIGYKTQATNTNAFASGNEAVAQGSNSFSIGTSTLASGTNSLAMGYESLSSGYGSFAAGNGARATDTNACAIGAFSEATNNYSNALGYSTLASGYGSTAIGLWSEATGNYSTALGTYSKSTGFYSTSFGYFTTAQPYCSFVIGRYNVLEGNTTSWSTTDPLFLIGNGSSDSERSNAFEVQKNGRVIIPELPSTTSSYGKTYVQVDTNGKLCVPGKGEYPGSEEIELLKEENKLLLDKIILQEQRIAKLEETVEKMLK